MHEPIVKASPVGWYEPVVKTSPVRWYILIVFALNSLLQSIELLMYQSVPEVVYECYSKAKIDSSDLNLIISIGSIASILSAPLMIFFDAYFSNIRDLTLICVVLLNLQNVLRLFPHWIDSLAPYALVFMITSQVLNNVAMLFSYGLPSRVSSAWFPPTERVVSTGLSSLVNPIGQALSFFIVPISVGKADDFVIILYVLLGLQALISILIVIYFPEKPAYPPSYSELAKEKDFEEKAQAVLDKIERGEDPLAETDIATLVPLSDPSTAPPVAPPVTDSESAPTHDADTPPAQPRRRSSYYRIPRAVRARLALRPV